MMMLMMIFRLLLSTTSIIFLNFQIWLSCMTLLSMMLMIIRACGWRHRFSIISILVVFILVVFFVVSFWIGVSTAWTIRLLSVVNYMYNTVDLVTYYISILDWWNAINLLLMLICIMIIREMLREGLVGEIWIVKWNFKYKKWNFLLAFLILRVLLTMWQYFFLLFVVHTQWIYAYLNVSKKRVVW